MISLFSAFNLCLSIDSLHQHLNLLKVYSPLKNKNKNKPKPQQTTLDLVHFFPWLQLWLLSPSLSTHLTNVPEPLSRSTSFHSPLRSHYLDSPSQGNCCPLITPFACFSCLRVPDLWQWLALLPSPFFENTLSPHIRDHAQVCPVWAFLPPNQSMLQPASSL